MANSALLTRRAFVGSAGKTAACSLFLRHTFATAATAKANSVLNGLRIGAVCHFTFV